MAHWVDVKDGKWKLQAEVVGFRDLRRAQWGKPWPVLPGCLAHVVNLGNVDVMSRITKIAAIQTLAIKIQASGQRIELFEKLQIECDIMVSLKIPLHSNVQWGTVFNMLTTADQWYGPITTIRREGRVVKHILWSAFHFSKTYWERVSEASHILAQSFSAEKEPTLWRALPTIKELQTAWKAKHDKPVFAKYRDAISDGLEKINKYYSRFNEKPAFILALGEECLQLSLHPYYKLAYIELAWCGAKEQKAEYEAGNFGAKNWQDEAWKILEKMQDGGWEAEIRRYLKDLPANVTKDTNIVEWWQVEEIDDGMREYQDFLAADQELEEWDVTEDEIV
ncbi:hypothetical protein V8E52_008016 [Russula decolorans]